MKKEKKFTLKTTKGCIRLFALFLCLVLVFSCAARLMSSSGGRVKISEVSIDSRGATINGDLYYPAGTSDEDSLPAIVVAHGGGVELGVMRGTAEELARRGFVVLNINAYGVSMSESPVNDDGGQGEDGFNNQLTPSGVYDAVSYLRTLKFVDQERIGLTGHSMGSRRTAYACMIDCGYYSLNDLKINILYDTFGQTFTEDEINENADALAEARLNEDQLQYYNALKAETEEYYNTRVKSLCLMGSDANLIGVQQTVTVGGFEVLRNCQVNIGIVDGQYDYSYRDYNTRDTTKEAWHTGTEDIQTETWYVLDDVNGTSTILGSISEVSAVDNEAFQAALENRTLRSFQINAETHSKNFFSAATTSDVVKFFEQTLGYNNGELGAADANPIDAESSVFMWREVFNFLAMLSMIGMLFPLAAIIMTSKFFKPCIAAVRERPAKPFNKKKYWLFALLGIVIEFIAIHLANGVFVPGLPSLDFLPFFPSWWLIFIFIAILAVGSAIMLLLFRYLDKKENSFGSLNVKMKFVNIMKTVLLAAILLTAAYMTLVVIIDLFNEDFRMWMAVFTEMKTEYWGYIWRYTICMLPCFLLIGASTNYSIRTDIAEWKDTLITVVINSAGVYLCCLVNYLMLVGADNLWSSFISTYGMLVVVPITVYITRKMYKLTNSIWLGALTNSFLVSWCICSAAGLNCNVYNAQTWYSTFFNV